MQDMFDEFVKKQDLPAYRLNQLHHAYYKEAIGSFAELTTWSKELREQLTAEIPFSLLTLKLEKVSKRGDTVKNLFARNSDGQMIEAVLMRHEDGRNTVCVSCMVGCPVNCTFCATGQMGFRGSLQAQEIVDQVLYFQRFLKKQNQSVTNVVYMGMGEPMLNKDEVEKSIEILTNPKKMGLGVRRITVSTSGYVPQFRQFVKNGYRGRVAVSLHASNQELRSQLMPVARAFSLPDLMAVLDEYTQLTNKRISYEYIMIADVNDTETHAKELATLLHNRLSHVNLIPYNPVPNTPYQRSSREAIDRFSEILTSHNVNNSVRVTMGDDIDAACGQLASMVPTPQIMSS